jgi:hypothetical protein
VENHKSLHICNVTFHQLGYGYEQITLWVYNIGGPIAHIWFRQTDKTIQILHTFTIARFRRQGAMRFLFDTLVQSYPDKTHLVTDSGTEDGGLVFLKTYGFKQQPPNGYVYEILRSGA